VGGAVFTHPGTYTESGYALRARVVPPGWQLQPRDPSWRGNRYVSPDGSSWFAAYSLPTDSELKNVHMNAIASREGEAVTYLRQEPDWLAVSGLRGNRIFYRKAVIACGGKIWHHIAFEYPAVRKREMDPFVVRASHSIDPAENDSCEDPDR
jgi:hypothetical protein